MTCGSAQLPGQGALLSREFQRLPKLVLGSGGGFRDALYTHKLRSRDAAVAAGERAAYKLSGSPRSKTCSNVGPRARGGRRFEAYRPATSIRALACAAQPATAPSVSSAPTNISALVDNLLRFIAASETPLPQFLPTPALAAPPSPAPLAPPINPGYAPAEILAPSPILTTPGPLYELPRPSPPSYPAPQLPGPIDQQKLQAYRNSLVSQQWQLQSQGLSPSTTISREIVQQLNAPDAQ